MKRAVAAGLLTASVLAFLLVAAPAGSAAVGVVGSQPAAKGAAQAESALPRAAVGGQYSLARVVVASGGAVSGGAYRLGSSLAQAEAGPTQRGGVYVMRGGFVNAPGSGARSLYLPQIVR